MTYASQNQTHVSAWPMSWLTDWRTINVALVIFTATFFVGYLVVNNRTVADGFTEHSLERRVAELEEQKRQLDLQMLDRQSMDTVETRAQELGFVPVSKVEYLTAGAGAVAIR